MEEAPGRAPVVVLVSGSGTLLQALLDAAGGAAAPYRVAGVVSDRPHALGLERARSAGVPTAVVAPVDFPDRAAWDDGVARAVGVFRPRLVVLAGFMRLLGPSYLGEFGDRTINTHPALLPAFPGAHAVRDALAHRVKVTGTSVILVDEGTDTGPIVAQRAVEVLDGDDEATLHERIKVVERELLVDVVSRMTAGGWKVTDRKVELGMSEHAQTSSAGRRPVRRALVSVYDKTGLEELARGLHEAGAALVSTGSTAARIAAAGVPVTAVDEVTGFPEAFDGRVKTLHPRVHAGLLADRTNPEHVRALAELGIEPFDLLVSNLYPFRETVLSGASPAEVVEEIDIGGPAMVRAAAKNHASVAVVTDPAEYGAVLDAVRGGGFDLAQRQALAARAFAHTAAYDVAVASWAGTVLADTCDGTGFPAFTGATWTRAGGLRYGENPHQAAALYRHWRTGLAHAEQLHGKEMSYNNYVDTDAAWRAAHDHAVPCVAIIKHANPCGIAVGTDLARAYELAFACDPVSAYGGVVATNGTVTVAMAEQVAEVFTEVVAAADFEPGALDVLRRKKNVRLLRVPSGQHDPVEFRPISGGVLAQQVDRIDATVAGPDGGGDDPARWRLATGEPADADTLADLAFAWRAVRAVKSNAILLARGGASVGIGMGQVNRVDSCRLAVARAGEERARGAVAASDAFFPFPDGLEVLLEAGVRAVVQPGGSVRDDEVIAAARAAGATVYLTGTRHFAH